MSRSSWAAATQRSRSTGEGRRNTPPVPTITDASVMSRPSRRRTAPSGVSVNRRRPAWRRRAIVIASVASRRSISSSPALSARNAGCSARASAAGDELAPPARSASKPSASAASTMPTAFHLMPRSASTVRALPPWGSRRPLVALRLVVVADDRMDVGRRAADVDHDHAAALASLRQHAREQLGAPEHGVGRRHPQRAARPCRPACLRSRG